MSKSSGKTIRVGLIGAGERLRGLITHVRRRHPGASIRFAGLCDPREGAAEALERVAGDSPRVHADYSSLVSDPEIDWVWVGSWNCFHCEHAVAAMRAGKHIFLEKPLATNLEDCLAIRKVQEETGRSVFFGFCLRYAPHYRRLHEIVSSGELGSIVSLEFNETLYFSHGGYIAGNWRRNTAHAGSHLLEKCCHDMDVANWLIGSRARRVASFGGRNFFVHENKIRQGEIGKSPEGSTPYMEWPDPGRVNPFDGEGDIVDNQVAILEYANGVRATFHTNLNASLNERRMYILGTKGTLRSDAVAGKIEFMPIGYSGLRREEFTGETQGHSLADKGLVDELVPAMMDGHLPPTGIREGLEAAVTCFGIDEALDTGSVVDLTPLWKQIDQSSI
jgi:predicted dehydrogenase